MTKSESIAELAKALSKAQGAMKNAVKDSSNPFFKSKYADLAAVADACRAELTANGLAVAHFPETVNGQLMMSYLLTHSSGEWMGASIDMNPVKSDPQGIGSVITYMRRYTLAAVAGVATEDDDGNAASHPGNNGHAQTTKPDVTFKKSAPTQEKVNPSVSASPGEGEAQIQKGGADPHSTAAAPAVVLPSGNGMEARPSAVEYITAQQAQNFHKTCRAAVRERRKLEADDLIYQWLGANGFKDSEGRATAGKIPAGGWFETRDKAVAWLKQQ